MVYMLIYEKENGHILAKVSGDQKLESYCSEFPSEQLKKLSSIYIDNPPDNHKDYKIINGELIQMSDEEIKEIRQYGRILTEEEKQLQKLKPSYKEVQKAENTIEILTLLQEVM